MKLFFSLVEDGLVPDLLVRKIIRKALKHFLEDEDGRSTSRTGALVQKFIDDVRNSPLYSRAEMTDLAALTLPVEFYELVLGGYLKFSSCYWPQGVLDLAEAEVEALKRCARRGEVQDGMRLLDFGCGWGANSISLAESFPNCSITSVSYCESHLTKISSEAEKRGLKNITTVLSDIHRFKPEGSFDRIFSIESLVYQTNLEKFMQRFSKWLSDDGKLFVQLFCHKDRAYILSSDDEYDWMSRYFINAGVMPSDSMMLYFQRNLVLDKHWRLEGTHYSKTAEAWLSNLDAHKHEVMPILVSVYGADAGKWFNRWRMFLLTFSELFKWNGGNEWFVSHYLFSKRCGACC